MTSNSHRDPALSVRRIHPAHQRNLSAAEPTITEYGKYDVQRDSRNVILGNGRSQPPQKSVTATAETTKMLAYSARK